MEPPKTMINLFFSYSHRDEALRDKLETHLAMLKRQSVISTWHDRRIGAGREFDQEISQHLEEAEVILLLVSPNFLASDYCYDLEMTRALERHMSGDARVIPVILRPCDWHSAPFGKLMAVPKDGKPVTKYASQDDAFLEVVQAIRETAEEMGAGQPSTTPAASTTTQPRSPDVRSSNLRVRKEFTDRDRDRFLHESFEYLANFFENSLAELADRNPKIETVRPPCRLWSASAPAWHTTSPCGGLCPAWCVWICVLPASLDPPSLVERSANRSRAQGRFGVDRLGSMAHLTGLYGAQNPLLMAQFGEMASSRRET